MLSNIYPILLNVSYFDEATVSSLENAITTNDENVAEAVINNMANDIANHFLLTNGIDLHYEFENDNTRIVLLGLIEAVNQQYINNPSSANLNCFFAAVEGFIGLTNARSIWRAITTGSYSVGTLIDALKLLGKRVATVITVGIMVYNVGACVGWWYAEPIPDTPITTDSTIPIDFFNFDRIFYNMHFNNLVLYLEQRGWIPADEIIEYVYDCRGDLEYIGTSIVEDYFNSLVNN